MKRKIVKAISILISAVLVLGAGYFAVNKHGDFFVKKKSAYIAEFMNEKLQNAARLETADYLCTVVGQSSESKQINGWKIPLTGKSCKISYNGTVSAGIKDLTKATIHMIDEKTVAVKLPAVEITGSHLDTDSFEVIDESHNIFNRNTAEDFNNAQKDIEEKMKKRAIEYNILGRAKANAETLVSVMLKSPNGEYEVVVEWQ